jgi:hypothetical protein
VLDPLGFERVGARLRGARSIQRLRHAPVEYGQEGGITGDDADPNEDAEEQTASERGGA